MRKKVTSIIFFVLLGIILVLLLIFPILDFVASMSTYRIAADGNSEILYITNNVAIKRKFFPANLLQAKRNVYSLCKAHYVGLPDYKFQTGHIIDRLLIENIVSINASKDGSIIIGTFMRHRRDPKSNAYFAFMNNTVNIFDKKDDFKSFLHDCGIPSVDFISPKEFIDTHK